MSRYPPRRISLLVRNLPLDARADELRTMFERYGEVRDVYLPRDYYTDRPRGFGFVEFLDGRDAEEAMYHLDGMSYGGREISVVLSKESRKTPSEMYNKDRYRRGSKRRHRSPGRRRSYSRSPGHRRSYSRSPSPRYRHRSRSGGYSRRYERRSKSPARDGRRYYRRSGSPSKHGKRDSPYSEERRYRNGRSVERHRSKSPPYDRQRRSDSKSIRSDKPSSYSSSRSRSMSAEGERDYSPREKVEEPRQEEPQDHPKKSSLSPQSGRHESDPLFHPAASPVQDP